MNIYVISPEYTNQSCGVKVLHYLMDLLIQLGHNVYSNCETFSPNCKIKPITKQVLEISKGFYDMAILPEVVTIKVKLPSMRWVMYYPGQNGGPLNYDKNEIVYHWSDNYKEKAIDSSWHKESELFSLPVIDMKELDKSDIKQYDSAVWVYKGYDMHKHPKEAIEITRDIPRERALSILRYSKVLYSYDRHSLLNVEAYLLGAEVKLFNYKTKQWENFKADPIDCRVQSPDDKQLVKDMLQSFKHRCNVNGIVV